MACIAFGSFAQFVQRNGKTDSDLASGRYRVLIPARELQRRGHHIDLFSISNNPDTRLDPDAVTADVYVLSKSMNAHNEEFVKALRARNVCVIFDMCDDYFVHPAYGIQFQQHTIRMCTLVNKVVTSTPTLNELVRQYSGVDATTIIDPVEGARDEARFAPALPDLKLLWFGHHGNLGGLIAQLPAIAALGQTLRLHLHIVTTNLPEVPPVIAKLNGRHQPHLSITFTPWTTQAIWPALKQCDLVLIPTKKTDFHAAKSANRLTESLWSGRAVVAHPLRAYLDYEAYAYLTENMTAGIQHAVENRAATQARIVQGQDYISRVNAPPVIATAWEEAMGLTSAGVPSAK